MIIDHITLAVPDLDAAAIPLAGAGLEVTYGGVHSTGKTHMSLCGFADGSYLEVVAPFGGGRTVSLWHDYQLPARGGAAWTVAAKNVGTEIARAQEAGIAGRGPIEIRRKRPDGDEGRWELGYLGNGHPGATLPFLIRDFTDRSIRVAPHPRFEAVLSRWAFVVLAVFDVHKTAKLFQSLYGCAAYGVGERVVALEGLPVYLTSPADFLDQFGEAPCAAVLRRSHGSDSWQFRLRGNSTYGVRRVDWLDLPWPHFQIGLEELKR